MSMSRAWELEHAEREERKKGVGRQRTCTWESYWRPGPTDPLYVLSDTSALSY